MKEETHSNATICWLSYIVPEFVDFLTHTIILVVTELSVLDNLQFFMHLALEFISFGGI